ncbi:NAD(P)H-dependent oxidoreductase [Streptomyces sp. AC512_CC834]|uniref:NAD(P)H-dependent oxidoreductase n=1 Tax=Streptomyces sp. AC512_CC834 TaxID=2823691 RepID=UPI0020B8668B|nr:NAD(P)H-dependent oxidoreductase [Streptomyces sp. AC512_CC834]
MTAFGLKRCHMRRTIQAELLRMGELVAADVVLIAAPVYNFSVPASLKAWIDRVTCPKMPLAGRRFVVTHVRGAARTGRAPCVTLMTTTSVICGIPSPATPPCRRRR